MSRLVSLVLVLCSILACNRSIKNDAQQSTTITCSDAAGIGPDMTFQIGDPGIKVICINNICYQTASSSVCLYGCGQTQKDAGYVSPCWN